jgi:hypothetical protein
VLSVLENLMDCVQKENVMPVEREYVFLKFFISPDRVPILEAAVRSEECMTRELLYDNDWGKYRRFGFVSIAACERVATTGMFKTELKILRSIRSKEEDGEEKDFQPGERVLRAIFNAVGIFYPTDQALLI